MMNNQDIEQLLDSMVNDLQQQLQQRQIKDPVMIGIHRGGVWVAQRLHEKMGLDSALGSLDISFYRDDFTRIGMNPQVQPSELPMSIDDQHIILIDDVLHTGRTIRAAMNELFDYGRPASILLAVLVERNGQELPIQADVIGKHIQLNNDEHIKLTGPAPLELVLQKTS